MTSAQEEERGEGDAEGRGVHTFKPHILNHASLMKPFSSQALKLRSIASSFHTAKGHERRGEDSPPPLCECLLPREVERRDGGN